ncbi:MAG: succinate dehydrogenase cytochrome b subunit [Planctomycetales bacterium]|nr:succinate dehydrogenase cytochrome b subunit [Planctomycetales bacterium]
MNWLRKVLVSSIGKKVQMGISGLLLCGFLVAHLGGNLLLFVPDGGKAYNEYAHALHTQKLLLPVAEIGLVVLFAWHLLLALTTNKDNADARPVGYALQCSKQEPGPIAKPASSVMMATGAVVFLFLILHLADFRFELRNHGSEGEEPFAKAARLLKDPITCVGYIIGTLVLGYHVLHGFQSAFQSLGLNHPKYTPLIKQASFAFAILVGAGFASLPLWFGMISRH